jgi:hypothetical protein
MTRHGSATSRCCSTSWDLSSAVRGLIQNPGERVPTGAERQRLGIQVPWLANSRSGGGIEGDEDQALHPNYQRQGRAVWPPADCVYFKALLEEWRYVKAYSN